MRVALSEQDFVLHPKMSLFLSLLQSVRFEGTYHTQDYYLSSLVIFRLRGKYHGITLKTSFVEILQKTTSSLESTGWSCRQGPRLWA